MNFLIDTHVLLWYMLGDSRLSKKITSQIEDINHSIFVSKVSLWEVAIKASLKKLEIKTSITGIESYLIEKKISVLDFDFQDLQRVAELEFHHRDPFDRLIISQGINHNLTIISDDPKFKLYPVQLLQ